MATLSPWPAWTSYSLARYSVSLPTAGCLMRRHQRAAGYHLLGCSDLLMARKQCNEWGYLLLLLPGEKTAEVNFTSWHREYQRAEWEYWLWQVIQLVVEFRFSILNTCTLYLQVFYFGKAHINKDHSTLYLFTLKMHIINKDPCY